MIKITNTNTFHSCTARALFQPAEWGIFQSKQHTVVLLMLLAQLLIFPLFPQTITLPHVKNCVFSAAGWLQPQKAQHCNLAILRLYCALRGAITQPRLSLLLASLLIIYLCCCWSHQLLCCSLLFTAGHWAKQIVCRQHYCTICADHSLLL